MRPHPNGPSVWDRLEAESGYALAVECARRWLEQLPLNLSADALDAVMAGKGAVTSKLADALRGAGLDRWAALAELQGTAEENPEGLHAKALLFRAGLGFLTSSPREDFPDVAKAAFDQLRYSERDAPDELAAALADNLAARVRLETVLADLIEAGRTDPNRLAWRPRPRELDPVPPTTQNLWSRAYSTAMIRHVWAFGALRVDPAAYTRLLHTLPVGLAHTTILLSGALDLDGTTQLVRVAPSAFSAGGAPVASGLLYALLERAHQQLANVEGDRTDQAVNDLVEAVLARSDGAWLGRTWCQRVLWEVSHRDRTKAQTWPGLVFNALTKRLEPLPVESSHAWVCAEMLDLWQVDRVIVEVAVLLDHDRRAEAPSLLEWALAENRVTSTGRDRALDPLSFEADLIRQVFAGEDLRAWFEKIWTAGYARRERHRIGAYRAIDDTARASLCWGLAGLNAQGPGRSLAWTAIFGALREMYLLDERYIWIGEVGPAIFRFAGLLCTALAKQGELGVEQVEAFLELTVEPTLYFGGFVAAMIQQDQGTMLSAAQRRAPGQVKWALENGVLAFQADKSLLTPEALASVKAFSGKLP